MSKHGAKSMDNEGTGRARGGHARANALSPTKRSQIAKLAAQARWAGGIKTATHGSDDHPLRIGDIEIPCYVLEGEIRVISQRGTLGGLNLGRGTGGGAGGDRLSSFLGGKGISPHVSKELMEVISNPIKFRHPRSGFAFGYPATILPDLCEAVLAARAAGALMPQQEHIATRCEVLVRGFARVGIIALIDEATGYQHDRAKDALAKILEAFIAKELQPWVKTFPDDFYAEMFRLRGLEYPRDSVRRPQYFGMFTNDIVYKRLAPGVLDELKSVTPKLPSGRLKDNLFQRLTRNIGYPKLREHLGSVVTIMKLSNDWHDFMGKLNRLHPPHGKPIQLALEYGPDNGKGL
jgi:hypothetical protein